MKSIMLARGGSAFGGKKFLVLPAAIFFLAAGCNTLQQPANQQANSAISQPASPNQQQQTASPSADNNQAAKPSGQTQAKQNPPAPDYPPNSQNNAQPAAAITVSQTVDGSSINQASSRATAGETAIDLLKSEHQIEEKVYAGIGDMVLSIDGMKPDSQHFWAFYVNGQFSNVGASTYVLKNGDNIEWKLESIK